MTVCVHYYINIFAKKRSVMLILVTTKLMKGIWGALPPPRKVNLGPGPRFTKQFWDP